MENQSVEIPWRTILKIAVTFALFYLIYLLKDVLILSLFALMVSILFETPIRILEKRIPRSLAVIFLYVLVFSCITLLIYLPAAKIVSEAKRFIGLFPVYFEEVSPFFRGLGIDAFKDLENFVNVFEKIVRSLTVNVFNVLFSIFGGLASTVFVISLAIFLSLEGGAIEDNIVLFFAEEDKNSVKTLWRKSQKGVGLWFVKTVLGCLFVGLASYLCFLVLGMNYSLVLASLGGVLNFVPVLGPTLAVLIICAITGLDSLSKAIFALLIYVVVQQIENNIVSPLLARKFIGLSPALVLISLAIGAQLFGLLGAILVVPLTGMAVEFIKGVAKKEKEEEDLEAS